MYLALKEGFTDFIDNAPVPLEYVSILSIQIVALEGEGETSVWSFVLHCSDAVLPARLLGNHVRVGKRAGLAAAH